MRRASTLQWMRRALIVLIAAACVLAIWSMRSATGQAPVVPPEMIAAAGNAAQPLAPLSNPTEKITQYATASPYELLRHSDKSRDRTRAYRLWTTCAQRMNGAPVAERRPDQFIAALPDAANHSQRQAALAAIDSECRTLIGAPVPAILEAESRQLEFDATHGVVTPAALGIKLMLDQGDRSKALLLLHSTLREHDPESFLELAMANMDLASESDMQEAARMRRAALGLLACDNDAAGACNHHAMIALKLCAFQASCDGPVSDRVIPLLGFSEGELRPIANLLRVLLGRGDDSAVRYLVGMNLP